MELILASAAPRRKEMLKLMGYDFSVETIKNRRYIKLTVFTRHFGDIRKQLCYRFFRSKITLNYVFGFLLFVSRFCNSVRNSAFMQ